MSREYTVIPGAESFYLEGNEIGIVLSHGFIGTPQSVREVAEALNQKGFSVFAPRLKGHGTHQEEMETCTHDDWYNSYSNACRFLKKRGKRIFLMGQSMGGTLTLKFAAAHQDIEGIITINAALTLPSLDYLQYDPAPRFIPEGAPDIKKDGVHEIAYEEAPVAAVRELQKLMKEVPSVLHRVRVPALCIKSAVDHVVPPENTSFIYQAISSKQKKIVTLRNSYHVATMDYDANRIVEEAAAFIEETIQKQSAFRKVL
ncbi:alpha/beta fold hydrolase [Domibacillus sp. PGB-M46]|uniref:alpha/beta hydrolase n=1 Tax=Domibacillus sp. PGB-M46 TaxID=2910255 RepID=UPI001F579006|nr:alpha/beta fold hydrolase [Domibacillus sp. PGB-M46]MCI2254998.1 alpha/beta fold hydrolase [Domibacillus sp. PGB-M46]